MKKLVLKILDERKVAITDDLYRMERQLERTPANDALRDEVYNKRGDLIELDDAIRWMKGQEA